MRGFTLIELIISISIAALVGWLLLSILVNNTGVFYKQSSRVTQGLGINDALSSIRSSIKVAQSVDQASTDTKLMLKIPAVDSSGNVISDIYDQVVYSVIQNKLYYQVVPDVSSSRKSADQILTDNVSIISFNYYDSSDNPVSPGSAVKVSVTMTLNGINMATSEANLRND